MGVQAMRLQPSRLLTLPLLRFERILGFQPSIDRRFFSPIWKQQKHICSRPCLPLTNPTVVCSQKDVSLAWVQPHDYTPVGYGVDTFFGFVELIPPNVTLPCKATRTLESAFDYLKGTDIPECYRTSMLHLPTQITHMTLNGLRIAKKENTRMKVRMEIRKDLSGTVTAWDVFTRSTTSVEFDGRVAIQTQGGDKAVLNLNS